MKLILILVSALSLYGCSSGAFYSQALSGQLDLLFKRQSIESLLRDQGTDEIVKARLQLVQDLRSFAEASLLLPVEEAYSSYSDLERPYALWNIYAAPELSLKSHRWCYPLAGCFAYRGYFNEAMANREAQKFIDRGYDVKVGGILAYSTVGWFDDPVLNTFLLKSEPYLVELLFHEIAHRKIYIKNDTKFNENFATAVALLGSEQWYKQGGDTGNKNLEVLSQYSERKVRHESIVSMLLGFKGQLEDLYSSEILSDEEKRQGKQGIFENLRQDYLELKRKNSWDGNYDNWVMTMNNATLATVSNYQALVPLFVEIFRQTDGNWKDFYREIERISVLERTERYRDLNHYK